MSLPINTFVYTTNELFSYPPTSSLVLTAFNPVFFEWSQGDWAELIAATPEDWLIASIVQDQSGSTYEVDIGVGALGVETVFATVAGGSFLFQIPLAIPAGTRISMRFRGAGFFLTGNLSVAINYYKAPVAGTIVSASRGTVITGSGTAGTALTPSGTPWVSGAWAVLHASTPEAWAPVGIYCVAQAHFSAVPSVIELDIGIGGPGSETVVTTTRVVDWFGTGQPSVLQIWPVARVIPAGSRVVARVRAAIPSLPFDVKLTSYPGLLVSALTTTQRTLVAPPAQDAPAIAVNPTPWANSDFVTILDPTPSEIAITQIIPDGFTEQGQYEVDVGAVLSGAAPNSETVVSTIRFGLTVVNQRFADLAKILKIPVTVPAGYRVALRVRASAGVSQNFFASALYIANPDFAQQSPLAVQRVYIQAAGSVSPDKPAGAFAWSDWAELKDAVESDILASGISYRIVAAIGGQVIILLQLGVGPDSGSVTPLTTLRPNEYDAAALHWIAAPYLTFVAEGSRLWFRWTSSSALADVASEFAATYYGVIPAPPPDDCPELTDDPAPDPPTPVCLPLADLYTLVSDGVPITSNGREIEVEVIG